MQSNWSEVTVQNKIYGEKFAAPPLKAAWKSHTGTADKLMAVKIKTSHGAYLNKYFSVNQN